MSTPEFKKALCFAGAAGSGKDYVVGKLFNEVTDEKILFAGPMKEAVSDAIFKLFPHVIKDAYPEESFSNRNLTETQFENIKNDPNIKFELSPGNKFNCREILQLLGTEVIRGFSANFHIKLTAKKILQSDKQLFFITDARFSNELNFAKRLHSFKNSEQSTEFLEKISAFDKELSPSAQTIEESVQKIFGRNQFANEISAFVNSAFNDKSSAKKLSNSCKTENAALGEPFEFTNFKDDLNSGIIFINRKSERVLSEHPSEKIATDRMKFLKKQSHPEYYSFLNDTDGTDSNPQFDILNKSIHSLRRNNNPTQLPESHEYTLLGPLRIIYENPLSALRELDDSIQKETDEFLKSNAVHDTVVFKDRVTRKLSAKINAKLKGLSEKQMLSTVSGLVNLSCSKVLKEVFTATQVSENSHQDAEVNSSAQTREPQKNNAPKNRL